ncbi:MAG TPA: c-type cytochrome [Phenylobacterium sp.]
MKSSMLMGVAIASALVVCGRASAADGDVEAGKAVYNATCKACHGGGALAPTLRGVGGRKIASIAEFPGYSTALKAKADQTWTAGSLDAFLKSPPAFAPGTHMIMATPDDTIRANLVAYLLSLKPPS